MEKALLEQIELLRREPVSATELTKAKNQVLTGKVMGTLSTEQKALELGQADLDYGDPGEANKEFDQITRVSAADIQRVAQKYFVADHRNIFNMLPASMRAGAPGAGKEAKP